MAIIPPVDPRTRVDLLNELWKRAEREGFSPRQGGLLGTLLTLYSYQLTDIVERLNRMPDRHRLALLNLWKVCRLPANPAETVVVFRPAEGYDKPVLVPTGTLVAARPPEGETVLFRTKWAFYAQPVRLLEAWWADGGRDQAEPIPIIENALGSFCPWTENLLRPGSHTVDFLFSNIFYGKEQSVGVHVRLELGGKPIGAELLAEADKFAWSLLSPECSVLPSLTGEGSLVLNVKNAADKGTEVVLRLELLDSSLIGIVIREFGLEIGEANLAPEVVVTGSHEPGGQVFYPFGSPLGAYEECGIFCGQALSRPGAEIQVSFAVAMEVTEESTPSMPQPVDYRWIMRRPEEPPAPSPWEAFCQQVRWEYWNGTGYRELKLKKGTFPSFTQTESCHLVFDCPEDLVAGSYGGREGFYLRLSSGACDALYRLPRRVYTPRMERLQFSFCHGEPVSPISVSCQNFGGCFLAPNVEELRPFQPLPLGRELALCLVGVPAGERLQLYVDLADRSLPEASPVRARLLQGENLLTEDGTGGFAHSGIIAVTFPECPAEIELFGTIGTWLCLEAPDQAEPLEIRGVWCNAQVVANRTRHLESFAASDFKTDGQVCLAHGNIIQLWVYVYQPSTGSWDRWQGRESSGGSLEEGFYQEDRLTGKLVFPRELFVRGAACPPAHDLVAVYYDTTNGAGANLPQGAIGELWDEVPYITQVTNPLPIATGWDSESDQRLADRTEHLLASGGRSVTPVDWERLITDFCPIVKDARCLPGKPPRLVVLMEGETFSALRPKLEAMLRGQGQPPELMKAEPIALHCRVGLPQGQRTFRLREKLGAYLDTFTGGYEKKGWPIGTLPTWDQLEAMVLAQVPYGGLKMLKILALDKDGWKDLRSFSPAPWQVMGTAVIQLEVCDDGAAQS